MGLKTRKGSVSTFKKTLRALDDKLIPLIEKREQLIGEFQAACRHPKIVEETPDPNEGGDFGCDPWGRLCTRCGLTDGNIGKGSIWRREPDAKVSRRDFSLHRENVLSKLGLNKRWW